MSDAVAASEPGPGVSGRTNKGGVKARYALCLLWLSLIFSIISIISNITELVFVDFIHGNPYRPKSNAIEMMWLFSIILGIISIIGCFLVFSLSQMVQAVLHSKLRHLPKPFSHLTILLTIPLLSVLTWYCWEYLTPTDFNLGINEGPDWEPYQHGITIQRYLSALAFQAPISLFSIIYCDPDLIRMSRKAILTAGLVLAVPIGIWCGHRLAMEQYGFLGG